MATEGVDYAWARPGGYALAQAGKRFAVRYMPYVGDGGKGLTLAEYNNLRANGISVAIVFETFAGRALDGFAAGVNDATLTLQNMARSGVPFPTTMPCYFAVDIDAQSWQMAGIDNYLRGAASVMGLSRVGVYGSYAVVTHCKAAGTARWFWQTYAWSYGALMPGTHLYQYHNGVLINGQEVDLTRAYTADYGQYPRPSATAPAPIPPSSTRVGGLPVKYTSRTGWSATIIKGKPRRNSASLTVTDLNYATQDEIFPIWGEVYGPAVDGRHNWFFGPQYINGWEIVYIPWIDLKNRHF